MKMSLLAPKELCAGGWVTCGSGVVPCSDPRCGFVLFPAAGVMCQPLDADCQPDCSCSVYYGGNDCNYAGACVNVFN